MIQSFRTELPWLAEQLPPTVEALETELLTALQPHVPQGAELLRWAVVEVKNASQTKTPSLNAVPNTVLVCEGAWIMGEVLTN
ncbi:MAG: hypothetical protein QE263_07650 [Vampirovibrionales bacterium]|nr:hypothetical protein [Vampirovibrionales bacterium]